MSWHESAIGDDEFTHRPSQFDMYEDNAVVPVSKPFPALRTKALTEKENIKMEKQCAKRKAKERGVSSRAHHSEHVPSKRKAQQNSLERVISRGLPDNVTKLQNSLAQYEAKVTGFDALMMKFDDSSTGDELFAWLVDIGFTASLNTDRLMQLPSSKVSALKAVLGKCRVDMHQKLHADFLGTPSTGSPSSCKIKHKSTSSSKHRSKKKVSSRARVRGVLKPLDENIMDGLEAGDVSLAMSLREADELAASNTNVNVSALSAVKAHSGCGSSTKTFGGTGSKLQKPFSVDAFGARVKVAPRVIEVEAEEEEVDVGVEEGGNVVESAANKSGSPTQSRLKWQDRENGPTKKLVVSVREKNSSFTDGEASFGVQRPMSTSAISCSSSSAAAPSFSCKTRSRSHSCSDNSTSADTERGPPLKSPRFSIFRRGDAAPTPLHWPDEVAPSTQRAIGDSVIKRLGSMALSSASKDNHAQQPQASLLPPSHYPPTPHADFLSSESLEDFIDEKDDGVCAPPHLRTPQASANNSLDLDTSAEFSIGGNKELCDEGGGGQSLLSFGLGGFTSGFTPPVASAPPPSLASCFRGCASFDSPSPSHDDSPLVEVEGEGEGSARGMSYSQGSRDPAYESWVRDSSDHIVPTGRRIKRNRTLPNRPLPKTPECRGSLSQNDSSGVVAAAFTVTAGAAGAAGGCANYSTPIAAISQHTCGRTGNYDLLLTEKALDFEIEMFLVVFRRKPHRSPVVRESTSPYLFSAMSNRHHPGSGGSNSGHSDEKQLAKDKKNVAFLRRMSSSAQKGSSFNPDTASKVKRNRKSIISNQRNIVNAESKVHWDDLDTRGGHASLDQNSFRGVVVGGTYENCFDDNVPVVSAPSAYDRRVVGVRQEGASMKVFLVNTSAKDKRVKPVNLGPHWVCYKISTGGFLVSQSEILPYQSCTCYFLPKHPKKWAITANNLIPKPSTYGLASLGADISPKSFMDASIVDCDTFYEEQECHDINMSSPCGDHLVSSIDHFAADESKIFLDPEELEEDHDQFADDQDICRKLHHSLGTSASLTSLRDDSDDPLDHVLESGGVGNSIPKMRFFSKDDEDEDEDDEESVQLVTQMTQDTEGGEVVFLHMNSSDGEDNTLDMSINALRLSDDYDDESSDCEEDLEDWNNSVILCNVMPFLLTESQSVANGDILGNLSMVSKSWALECFKVRAAALSRPGACQRLGTEDWVRFMLRHGEGRFLSAGACKDVFRVQPQSTAMGGGFQAVSVMDMVELRDRDVADSISRELEISMLCSSLVSLNICPNLLQVHSIFQSEYPPSCSLWKREGEEKRTGGLTTKEVTRARSKLQRGEFQFIRMEFCCSGDLEEVVRARQKFNPIEARSQLFQMCFSLYCCREQLSLRHYDVKLLNFFSTSADTLLTAGENDVQSIHVGFGEHTYALPLGGERSVVKLADFGTSSVGSATLSLPISVHQFTTLENTPPEYLFLGSHARECYSADTFCLGLSFLHLLAGEEPYEEHLRAVRCPPLLLARLKRLWTASSASSQYRVIAEVIQSLDAPSDSSEASMNIKNVLYDTFYRYMVMFDLDLSAISGDSTSTSSCEDDSLDAELECPYPPSNPVLQDAIECLGLDGGNSGRLTKAKRECLHQFHCDRAEWSVQIGTNPVMVRVRENLSTLGEGSLDLLLLMVNLDASKRCTLQEALSGPVFLPLRQQQTRDLPTSSSRSFMHYRNKQFLPIF